jgi:flavin-binding protein dodecin
LEMGAVIFLMDKSRRCSLRQILISALALSVLANDYEKVVAAARETLKELEFARVSDNKDAIKAALVSRTAMDKKVEITLENGGKNITNVKIRVGVFGDEKMSLTILEKIKANL